MKVLNCEQTRSLEREAAKEIGSYLPLMRCAGKSVAKVIMGQSKMEKKEVVIVCGKGNNGGDGFVAAVYLRNAGFSITVILAEGEPKTEDAFQMYQESQANHISILAYPQDEAVECIKKADIIVDAIFGIGFHGKIKQDLLALFEEISLSPAKVVSVDLPSGLECDGKDQKGVCIKADITVTFTTLKPVHVLNPGCDACGEIIVKSVGISEALVEKSDYLMEEISKVMVKRELRPRAKSANKGDFGTLLCICGSKGMAGAAVLSAKAAVRSGAGIVKMALPESIYPIVSSAIAEPVFVVMDSTKTGTLSSKCKVELIELANQSTACLIGCGMRCCSDTKGLLYGITASAKVPLVIDADGINIISENINVLKELKAPVVLTPHPGEMGRLLGIHTKEVQKNRLTTAKAFAVKYHVVLVLKGANTLIALPSGKVFVNRTGNPGMAKGGCGDVLAGMIASFLAQGMDVSSAAICGAYLHGKAGDMCAKEFSQTAMTPTDLIDKLPSLFLELER